jgi:hypothetical protein
MMLALLFALLFAPAAAAAAQPTQPAATPVQDWRVEGSQAGCIAYAAYRDGTVLSIFGLPGDAGIGFLLQNRAWTGLRDGAVYPLSIRFGDGREWPVPAIARREIDKDGPGLFFAMSPADEEAGLRFIAEFADANGMQVSAPGVRVERLGLQGSRNATVGLARCLSRLINGTNPFDDGDPAAQAVRL